MNNAGIGLTGTSWEGLDNWHKIFDVNVFGYARTDNKLGRQDTLIL